MHNLKAIKGLRGNRMVLYPKDAGQGRGLMFHLPAESPDACLICIQPDVHTIEGIVYPPI
jgi:hypothetical protein